MRSNHRCHSKLVRAGSTPTFLPQCTFWCRVLTDDDPPTSGGGHLASQCTFWCRALTDSPALAKCTAMVACLNAPSGAGCLPTHVGLREHPRPALVSMHLLVPGAYRHMRCRMEFAITPVSMHLLVPGAYRLQHERSVGMGRTPVSMHLLVPGAYRPYKPVAKTVDAHFESQCTFWCRVLTD